MFVPDSVDVGGMLLQHFQGHNLQCPFMCPHQIHSRRPPVIASLEPARGTPNTNCHREINRESRIAVPASSGHYPASGKIRELLRHFDTDRMGGVISGARIAASIAIVARHRIYPTGNKRLVIHIQRIVHGNSRRSSSFLQTHRLGPTVTKTIHGPDSTTWSRSGDSSAQIYPANQPETQTMLSSIRAAF